MSRVKNIDLGSLTYDDRVELIQVLVESLRHTPQEGEEISPELAAELDRRVKRMDDHPEDCISFDEAMEDLKRRIEGDL